MAGASRSRLLPFRTWPAAFLAIAFCLLANASRAQLALAQHGRPRVLVWVQNADDRGVVERMRGQVSDLDLELAVVEGSPADAGEPLPRLPGDAQAAVLVWFARPDPNRDQVVVHAMQADRSRSMAREVGDGAVNPNGPLSSSTLEAAALVVRGALRDMLASEPPAPVRPREAARPRVEPAAAADPAPLAPARLAFRGDAVWELIFDRAGSVRQGPGSRLGVQYGAFELAALCSAALFGSERDAYGRIELRRYSLATRVGVAWRLSRALALSAGVRTGVALYARNAGELAPQVTPNDARLSASALLGSELRFGWAPGSGPVELTLAAGGDWVPAAPRIGYEVDGRFEPSFVVRRLQPALGLGLAFRPDPAR